MIPRSSWLAAAVHGYYLDEHVCSFHYVLIQPCYHCCFRPDDDAMVQLERVNTAQWKAECLALLKCRTPYAQEPRSRET
jgi:hypothetical protein